MAEALHHTLPIFRGVNTINSCTFNPRSHPHPQLSPSKEKLSTEIVTLNSAPHTVEQLASMLDMIVPASVSEFGGNVPARESVVAETPQVPFSVDCS